MISRKDGELNAKQHEFEARELEMMTELSMLRERLKEPIRLPLQLDWRHRHEMPFEMGGYIQSARVQDCLYVGGGYVTMGSDNNYRVMEYSINTGEWTTLPPYRAHAFAMAVVSNELVLVGGVEHDSSQSKVLGVWKATWTHPYPDMPTPRKLSSALAWNNWLVVAGGTAKEQPLSCVEVLNTNSNQWHVGLQTPMPWSSMSTAVVGSLGYFMGGADNRQVHCICIQNLISSITSGGGKAAANMWRVMPQLHVTCSAPLSMSGSLLAIGGEDRYTAKTDIHLYQPDNKKWVKVGDLPWPRSTCTCAVTRGPPSHLIPSKVVHFSH